MAIRVDVFSVRKRLSIAKHCFNFRLAKTIHAGFDVSDRHADVGIKANWSIQQVVAGVSIAGTLCTPKKIQEPGAVLRFDRLQGDVADGRNSRACFFLGQTQDIDVFFFRIARRSAKYSYPAP